MKASGPWGPQPAADTCEICGQHLQVGDWPFCGHGRDHRPATVTVIGDEWPGGKTFEHLDHEPITVYSKSELQREMDKRNLRFADRYHPNDGPDWRAAIDPQTLENARALVSRVSTMAGKDDLARLETFHGEVRPWPR